MRTPCEIRDESKPIGEQYTCPYKDTYMGFTSEMCRVCCGEGVDEDPYPEEEEADA